MQKFLFVIKYMFKILISSCVILFVFCFPIVNNIFKPQNTEEELFYTKSEDIVLDMWHIESFEGGNSARKTFLDKIFREFNKQNLGVFISLKVMSLEEYNININVNSPDIISFTKDCKGVEKHLTTLERVNKLSKEQTDSVKYEDTIICYPYMLGRYCLISYSEKAIDNLCGQIIERKNKKIFPLGFAGCVGSEGSLSSNNIKYNSNIKVSTTQYENYNSFLKKEITTMLGTQRDVHRLKNRERNGSIDNLYYTYLDGYTDLVQYIGVTKNCKNIDIAKSFVLFTLSEWVQKEIANIGMFSVNKKIYKQDYMKEWEDSLQSTTLPKLFGEDNV